MATPGDDPMFIDPIDSHVDQEEEGFHQWKTQQFDCTRGIYQRVNQVSDKNTKWKKKAQLLAEIKNLLPDPGYSLFRYHALPFTTASDEKSAIAEVEHAWKVMSSKNQLEWKSYTNRLRGGLTKGMTNVLSHLSLNRHAPTASQGVAHSRRAEEIMASASEMEPPDELPALHFFLGGELDMDNLDLALKKILEAIELHLAVAPELWLCGRNSGVLMNFDPSDSTFAGVTARLQAATKRGLTVLWAAKDCEDVPKNIEWVLRPLIFWNRAHPAFQAVARELEYEGDLKHVHAKYSKTSEYCLAWMGADGLDQLRPLSVERKEEVVVSVANQLRNHVFLKEADNLLPVAPITPYDLLPLYPKEKNATPAWLQAKVKEAISGKFNLIDHGVSGFQEQLRHCFSRSDMTSDEYEDMFEQRFHALDAYTKGALDLTLTPGGGDVEEEDGGEGFSSKVGDMFI